MLIVYWAFKSSKCHTIQFQLEQCFIELVIIILPLLKSLLLKIEKKHVRGILNAEPHISMTCVLMHQNSSQLCSGEFNCIFQPNHINGWQ